MNDIAIRVENMGKMYRIGAAEKRPQNLREALGGRIASPFAYLQRMMRPPSQEETLWALRNVSFEVKRGEVVGIPSTCPSTEFTLSLSKCSGLRLRASFGATGRGRPRLLRQAQYKAQDPFPYHRADGGLRRDFVVSSVERSTAGWAPCWRHALSPAEGWARASPPAPPQAGGRTGRENIYPSLRSRASSERRHPFDMLRTSLGMKKADFQISNLQFRNSLACTCAWPLPWPPTVRLSLQAEGSRRSLEPETCPERSRRGSEGGWR